MKLNRKWLLLVALVLSVAMATTGTLAYLTDQDADRNTMTLGMVKIVQNEQERREDGTLDEFTQDKLLYPAFYEGTSIPWADKSDWVEPGNEAWKVVAKNSNVVDKFVTVTNIGTADAYVRTIIAYEGAKDDVSGIDYGPEGKYIHVVHNGSNVDPQIDIELLGYATIDGVKYTLYAYTYPEALLPDETTVPSLKQIYMDKEATNDVVQQYGEKYDILVLSQAVQVKGSEGYDAEGALNLAFNDGAALTAEQAAEWLVNPVVGSPGDKHDTNNPPSPFAKVTTLGANDTLTITKENSEEVVTILGKNRTIDTNGLPSWGLHVGKIPLDVAYQFEPTISADEVDESEYKYWHADFVVKASKDVPGYGIGLAGYYKLFGDFNNNCWVLMAEPNGIPANTEIRLVKDGLGGITLNYEEICLNGNDGIGFLCGAVALDGLTIEGETSPISAKLEPGTTLTVELRLYETKDQTDTAGNTKNEETGKYITTGTYTYTFN